MEPANYLTVKDAAKRLGSTGRNVRRLIRSGRLKARRDQASGRIYVSEDALREYTEAWTDWKPGWRPPPTPKRTKPAAAEVPKPAASGAQPAPAPAPSTRPPAPEGKKPRGEPDDWWAPKRPKSAASPPSEGKKPQDDLDELLWGSKA